MNNKNNSIVYSTNPDFFHKKNEDNDFDNQSGSFHLNVYVDKKNRSGKLVTIVDGYLGPESGLKEIEKMLKSKCGVGGSCKDRLIMIQGEHTDKIIRLLTDAGYQVSHKKK